MKMKTFLIKLLKWKNYSKIGQNAFDLYNSKYSDKVNYQKLMNIYEEMY